MNLNRVFSNSLVSPTGASDHYGRRVQARVRRIPQMPGVYVHSGRADMRPEEFRAALARERSEYLLPQVLRLDADDPPGLRHVRQARHNPALGPVQLG